MSIKLRTDLFIILFILIASVFPRIWQLNNYPPLIVDEPANVRDIDKLLSYDSFHPIDYEWGFGQATLVHYPALLMTILEPDKFLALRLTSVILSLLSLIPFYFIVKKRTDSTVAFCTTLIFSFSYYYLQFSRVGWTNIHSLFLGLYLLWFLDLSLEKKSKALLLLSGMTAGLTMYTYRAGEIYIFASFILLILGIAKMKTMKTKLKSFIMFVFGFIGIGLPWINKIFSDWELYNLRSRIVSVSNADLPYHGLINHMDIMIYQVSTTIKSWVLMLPINGGGIENPRYLPLNHGIVSPIIALLFLIGFIFAIYKFKDNFIWILLYLTGIIFGQIMTVDPPNGSRGLILLPIIYFFVSIGLFNIYKKLQKYSFVKPLFISGSLAVALLDFYFYIQWMHWIKV